VKQWADAHGIRQIHIKPEKGQKKSAPLQPTQAKAALEILLNPENTPVYIHCLNGGGNANSLMGCGCGES
jgi:tyrosine-protein phosphatase OCA6